MTRHPDEIRADAEARDGELSPSWEAALELDPAFVDEFLALAAVPLDGGHLDEKTRELLQLALAAAATHLFVPRIRQHVRGALRAGATAAEIAELLQLTSALGVHALTDGVAVLSEVLAEQGIRRPAAELDEHRQQLRTGFERGRGYWNSIWQAILDLDPAMFEAYTAFSSHPWRTGTFSPKLREFVYIAFDVSSTHLYLRGLKLHMENALRYGATPEELLEIIQLATLQGFDTVLASAPIVLEELAAAGRPD